MTDIELYQEIGWWIRAFHARNYFHYDLLKDFQHDIFLKLWGKTDMNREYIKVTCKYGPWQLMRSRYAKRMKMYREVVLVDSEKEPLLDFPDSSYIPDFEFPPVTKVKKPSHADARKVIVHYLNNTSEIFDSVRIAADALGIKTRVLYSRIGKPSAGRFTKRKLSHIKIINYYVDKQPLCREQSSNQQENVTQAL